MAKYLLDIEGLTVSVGREDNAKKILNEVSVRVGYKSIVGVVGGSGSGKTTMGMSVLQLLAPALCIRGGSIALEQQDLLTFDRKAMRSIRGKDIGMIFQEPLDAFNPVFTIGFQIGEVLEVYTDLTAPQREEKAHDLLKKVGIKEPIRVAQSFPHQLSGGMRQRAMIAQAIATEPKLLIADEPTSNLDVTLQARIMELFRRLTQELDLSIMLITHDLGMVKHLADEIFVMNEGRVVECGPNSDITKNPTHDYTKALIKAI